ncbi:MAG: carboxypeptidase-like regulatory domain-containing protein [Bacteroidia bacterium]
MNIYKVFILITLIGAQLSSAAQHLVKGRITDAAEGKELVLIGAHVQWMGNPAGGSYTNKLGEFEIQHNGESPNLIVSYVGYKTDTFLVENMKEYLNIYLVNNATLGGTTVRAKRITYGLSSKDPKFTYKLDEREFQKAACCNLSESFENAPAIDVSIGDAVTGTKQIKMLGLDGFYTMISREYMPAVRTLNSYFGMSFIPAAWVESIQITKGAGSIVNGHESIAGQINIQMKDPFDADKFMLDQFVSQAGRSETDLMYRWDLNKYVSTSAFARIAYYPGMQDNNSDGFMDMPSGNQISFMNRWKFYTDKHWEGELNLSYMDDQKDAGQVDYFTEDNLNLYGINVDNTQWDISAKLGKSFHANPFKSFGSQYQVNNSQLRSRYGSESNYREYNADAMTYYANLLYQDIIGNSFHTFQGGFSILVDEFSEQLDSMEFDRSEQVIGSFFEYTYKPKETFSIVLGLRGDMNSIYGFYLTPRLHSKYRFNKDKTSVRLSTGMGRRTSNILAQNQYLLASQREVQIIDPSEEGAYGLEQEVAVNSGISVEHNFKLTYFPATFIMDYFNTTFLNEVVVDRETDNYVRFYNQENGTRSHSFQAQLDLNPMRRTEIRMAYRMFDVSSIYRAFPKDPSSESWTTFRDVKPLTARHRAFVNLTQKTRDKWQFSTTLQWTGKQRVPRNISSLEPFTEKNFNSSSATKPFVMLNLQLSKQFAKFPIELYIGAENLLNYKQENPILSANDPFNDQFDASLVWAPVFGRMIYGGFRWRIKKDYNTALKLEHGLEHEDD